jgi:hypothetical protein
VIRVNGPKGSTRGRLKRNTSLVLFWAMSNVSKKFVMGDPNWLLQKEKKNKHFVEDPSSNSLEG